MKTSTIITIFLLCGLSMAQIRLTQRVLDENSTAGPVIASEYTAYSEDASFGSESNPTVTTVSPPPEMTTPTISESAGVYVAEASPVDLPQTQSGPVTFDVPATPEIAYTIQTISSSSESQTSSSQNEVVESSEVYYTSSESQSSSETILSNYNTSPVFEPETINEANQATPPAFQFTFADSSQPQNQVPTENQFLVSHENSFTANVSTTELNQTEPELTQDQIVALSEAYNSAMPQPELNYTIVTIVESGNGSAVPQGGDSTGSIVSNPDTSSSGSSGTSSGTSSGSSSGSSSGGSSGTSSNGSSSGSSGSSSGSSSGGSSGTSSNGSSSSSSGSSSGGSSGDLSGTSSGKPSTGSSGTSSGSSSSKPSTGSSSVPQGSYSSSSSSSSSSGHSSSSSSSSYTSSASSAPVTQPKKSKSVIIVKKVSQTTYYNNWSSGNSKMGKQVVESYVVN